MQIMSQAAEYIDETPQDNGDAYVVEHLYMHTFGECPSPSDGVTR